MPGRFGAGEALRLWGREGFLAEEGALGPGFLCLLWEAAAQLGPV